MSCKTVEGTIENKASGILQLTTPYSDGWRVFVDEKESKVIRVNTAFLGVNLPAGFHKVRFEYHTPWLAEGAWLSLAGVMIYILLCFIERRKRKHSRLHKVSQKKNADIAL